MTETTETTLNGENLDKWLERIEALHRQANHPNTGPAEAAAFRAKAEQLMNRFRVTESMLVGEDGRAAVTPGVGTIVVCPSASPYRWVYCKIAGDILYHVGARGVWRYTLDVEAGIRYDSLEIVGFESDIAYAKILYTSAQTYFASRMEPSIRPELSDRLNVYNLRNAGMERIEIARKMGWGESGSATAKVTRLYKEECALRGEPAKLTGRGNSVATYREAFRTAFPDTLGDRLWTARHASDGGSGQLVLANREEQVEEAFYERFPHLRPTPDAEISDPKPLTPAEQRKRERERERELKRIVREATEREARLRGTSAGRLGTVAGEDAARQVDILPSGGSKRLES